MYKSLPDRRRELHLRDPPPDLENYICGICFDIVLDPVLCQGKCSKKYCRRCADLWKKDHNTCPMKCSCPWVYRLTQSPKLDFKCPWSSQCSIEYAQQLCDHIQMCEFQQPQFLEASLNKKFYRCNKGHPLEFFTGSFDKMLANVCKGCKDQELTRSRCTKCQEFYCVKCRPPQCSQECCPIGHTYTKLQVIGYESYICDMCVTRPSFLGICTYDDSQCNFGICEMCYQKLPPKVQRSPVSDPKLCHEGHQLRLIPGSLKASCDDCNKTRACNKECKGCGTHYCMQCKGVEIHDNKCEHGHDVEEREVNAPTQCHICLKPISEAKSFDDEACGFTICSSCLQEEHSKSQCKWRFKVIHTCAAGHPLHYYSGKDEIVKLCIGCSKSIPVRLFCKECVPMQFYCFKCKPFSTKDSCLIGHPWLPLSPDAEESVMCLFCHSKRVKSQVVWCPCCRLCICSECKEKDSL